MADNVTLPGTGSIIASDDVGGAHYQIVKLAFGADGSVTQASSANAIPVTADVSSSTTATTSGADVNSTSTTTAALDCSKTRRVGVQVTGLTGTHATHVVELRGSVDDTNYYALSAEVTGEGIAEVETAVTKVVAKVKTAEGSAATADITVYAK